MTWNDPGGTYFAATMPAVIFSPPEEFAPAHTKIFFPESRTNTSPWFMEDHAISTWAKLRRVISKPNHLCKDGPHPSGHLEQLGLMSVGLGLLQARLHAALLDHHAGLKVLLELGLREVKVEECMQDNC